MNPKKTRRKIHISGGRGFIGRHISNLLSGSFDISVSDVEDVNVLEKEHLLNRFNKDNPDVIISLAGLMGAEKSKIELYQTFLVNSFGLLNVLEAAHLAGVKNLIYFSSLTVHGANFNSNKIASEEDFCLPAHPYATSKLIGEYFLKDYSKYLNINAVILRPTIIVGNLNGEANALNQFTRDAFNDETIYIYGEGKHTREYLSITDLISATNLSIRYLLNNEEKQIYETFIISSGEPISMIDLATKCINIVGHGKIEYIEKTSQSFSLISDINKAKNCLKWEPKVNVESMIMETLNLLKLENNDHK